jgi:hypothetical protein
MQRRAINDACPREDWRLIYFKCQKTHNYWFCRIADMILKGSRPAPFSLLNLLLTAKIQIFVHLIYDKNRKKTKESPIKRPSITCLLSYGFQRTVRILVYLGIFSSIHSLGVKYIPIIFMAFKRNGYSI